MIVGHDFSLSNETDSDIMTDYFPGIWAVKSQERILKYAKQKIAEGNTVSVTDYDNPAYHSLANWFIKELGINQPLFTEPETIKQVIVTNGKPSNLSQLKKYLVAGLKTHNVVYNDKGDIINEKDTCVLAIQSNAVIFEKTLGSGIKSWLELGKASQWSFSNEMATRYFINYEGKQMPSISIKY